MALTPKERARIIEEEQLRYETRQQLHREQCAQKHPRRRLWWIVLIVLAVAAYCHFSCGEGSCWHHGGMMGKHHCAMGEMPGPDGVEPGQPVPPKK